MESTIPNKLKSIHWIAKYITLHSSTIHYITLYYIVEEYITRQSGYYPPLAIGNQPQLCFSFQIYSRRWWYYNLGLAKTWPWNFGPEQCWSKKTPFTFHHNLIDSNSTVSLILVLKIVPGQNWGVFNLLKAEARLLCQRHVLCAAATFCATYHILMSKLRKRETTLDMENQIKKENVCFSRSQVTHPSRGSFIASIITASIFGTGY